MIRRFFIPCIALITLIPGVLTAQEDAGRFPVSKHAQKEYEDALKLRRAGQVDKATAKLEALLKNAPNCTDAAITLAGWYYKLDKLDDAARAFESVLALDSFYIPRTLYSLGRIYLQTGQYHRSRILLQRYLESGPSDSDTKANAELYLEKARFAETLVNHPVKFEPEKLQGPVNTDDSEALPAFTADGQYMLFTRMIKGQEDLYISHWDSTTNTWGVPRALNEINTTHNEGAHSVSADGSMIAFTACERPDGVGSCDIYFWQRVNGVWKRPVNAGSINSRGWDAHPALTPDGRGMYFSSDRPGGMGGRDIWYTERHGDRWTAPVNLGSPINTPGNEESPFLFFDGRTLYFMSDGHPGLGDTDLFFSTRSGHTWTKPKNLGYPINTYGHEGALSITPDRSYAYYTSDRDGQNDIYRFRLDSTLLPPPVSNLRGTVVDASDNKPVIAEIVIYDLNDSTEQYRYTTDADGTFSTALVHGPRYGLHAFAKGYAFWSGQVSFSPEEAYSQKTIRIALIPIPSENVPVNETPIVLRNVEFETGSALLLPSSIEELRRLLTLLQEHPQMHIDIRGYTDNVGTEEDNVVLSQSRARAVYQWLVDHGCDAGRLSYQGFGESMPVASNDTTEGRQENRRVEFVIVGD